MAKTIIAGFNEATAFRRGNHRAGKWFVLFHVASMRPRHFAVEISPGLAALLTGRQRFNEATAFRRGNRASCSHVRRRYICFNEATAFRRGNPRHLHNCSPSLSGFNEATAFRRGNRDSVDPERFARVASMRPRHFAVEIVLVAAMEVKLKFASMRPRHFAVEISS